MRLYICACTCVWVYPRGYYELLKQNKATVLGKSSYTTFQFFIATASTVDIASGDDLQPL